MTLPSVQKTAAPGQGAAVVRFGQNRLIAFDKAVYKDGSQAIGETPPQKDASAVDTLLKLNDLREKGVLTEEECSRKKVELLERI